MSLLLLLHAAATFYMVGLIWFVQVVHYPLFAAVGKEGFQTYQQRHMQRTGWVVGPPMLVEATTAIWILVELPVGVTPLQAWLGAGLLAVIWLSTALLQVPRHQRLLEEFDPDVQRSLVRTNWLRTAAWTARGVVALWMLG